MWQYTAEVDIKMRMSNCTDSHCGIWHFGWEGKANWKQHTTFFITLMHINSFLQHYLLCPFRRCLASQKLDPLLLRAAFTCTKTNATSLGISVGSLHRTCISKERWPGGHLNANDINYLSASVEPMTQITAWEKEQLDCQLKHNATKNKFMSVLQYSEKQNDWCTRKMDLLGRTQHLWISYMTPT